MLTGQHINNLPLVSVIIPCFNHGAYLPAAIQSVIDQTYTNIEVLVIDDGSSDNTKAVVANYTKVNYIHQQNQGLSAARNTGIQYSNGKYLLFLDADDWLYPTGIETNVNELLRHSDAAFVSGSHDAIFEDGNTVSKRQFTVANNHYHNLLQRNYIGMIATVLFQRWVFNEFNYNPTLRNCEDYDLYLRIARKHPIHHHQHKIAAYRLHKGNMSGNIPLMLQGVLHVLNLQQNHLQTETERQAYKKGQHIWKQYYCKELYKELLRTKKPASKIDLHTLRKYKPTALLKYYLHKRGTKMITKVKDFAPAFSLRLLKKAGLIKRFIPGVGQVNLGDLNRLTPLSKMFGYDRGGPIDRYYIENFLAAEKQSITGRVLEIGDNEYTLKFGGNRVTKSDILHVNEHNKAATFIGDISNAAHIPDSIFNCIVLTQTLHLIYDFKAALSTCFRIMRPGGTLLLTVPGITPIDRGEWKDTWYWSFTANVMQKIMAETFPGSTVEINSYGNILAATAFLYGMGLPEITPLKLDHNDPHYQVIITVKAQKLSKP